MTKQQFIDEIAKYVQKYAPQFGIKVYSPIIAQACLESAYGTSRKATFHNYFGLKYRNNRVTCNAGYFEDGGSEQNPNGTYTILPSSTAWYAFENLEMGVLGYFQFTNIANYANLKGVTDPYQYLLNIKADGYATSLNYVDNVYKVIQNWNLTKYDPKEEIKKEENNMGYSNSSLTTYTKISPNKTSPRNHVIDTITIHCIVGQWTAKQGCDYFAKTTRRASCNYVVGKDGSIGLCVEEKDRSWCSSNASNDHRAITIEVASDTVHPYAVTDAALDALIKLCADICKRNNIKSLKWKGDKSLIGKIDQQNMTVHRWFAAKACPGDYLYNKHTYIANEVNKILGVSVSESTAATTRNYLMKGDTGEEVKKLQTNLNALKYNCGTPDGIFGAKTESALKSFQKAYKLTVDGKYGEKSKQALEEAIIKKNTSFIVQITANALNIRKGPGTLYKITGCIKDKGRYTIVETQGTWGRLKSGAGWISIKPQYVKRV